MIWQQVLIGILVGLVIGVSGWWWLRRHSYRRDDELSLPQRKHWWLLLMAPLTGAYVTWALSAYTLPITISMVVFATLLLIPVAIDIDVQRLPNVFTLALAIFALTWSLVWVMIAGDWDMLWRSLLGGAAFAGFFLAIIGLWLLITRFKRGTGFGFGDVKLAFSLGVVMAWFSWDVLLAGAFLAFLLGGIWSIGLLITRKVRRDDYFQFGPFLAAGMILSLISA